MRTKRVLIGLAASIAAIIGSVVAAPVAAATPLNGCPELKFCFYYNSNFQGARADFLHSDGNLAGERFTQGGPGANGINEVVKNNAASAANNWNLRAVVYYNSNCNGSRATQAFAPYSAANFNTEMKNENASFNWPDSISLPSRDCVDR